MKVNGGYSGKSEVRELCIPLTGGCGPVSIFIFFSTSEATALQRYTTLIIIIIIFLDPR